MKFALLFALLLCLPAPVVLAQNEPMREMPVLESRGGALDLLMVATPKVIDLAGMQPTAWVYQVCLRATAIGDACPTNAGTLSPYGGVRLQLEPGDHLRIRLINHLPAAPPDAKHVYGSDPMEQEMLQANPTNLHTHGLIVEPRKADETDPSFGDYIYVLGYPAGKQPAMEHPGLVYTDKPINYDIYIPANHPSGVFWFHPHVHGLSLNQISEGMSGVITIGHPDDYLGDRIGSYGLHTGVTLRHLLLKDIEVEKGNSVLTQEDPNFCEPDAATTHQARPGYCPGVKVTYGDGVTDHTGGKWIFSVSGQVFPTETVRGAGEIWRIISGSGSRGYSLALRDDDTGDVLPFQVLSIDGVAIDALTVNTAGFAEKMGQRMHQVSCGPHQTIGRLSHPVCVDALRMMPSARTEIWLPSRIGGTRHATFLTQSVQTGPDGDTWPSVGLVRLTLQGADAANANFLEVRPVAAEMLRKGGILHSAARISVPGQDGISVEDAARNPRFAAHIASLADPNCAALPSGHSRRIFFGLPTGEPDAFGMGYEELDQRGRPVPGTFRDIAPFDHTSVTVCLPLAAGNQPVTERWELVNVAGEDHNFHIHQTRFQVIPEHAPAGDAHGIMDNVPLPHGSPECDGSVAAWRKGACKVNPVRVEIPFAEIGDFVYHCHILEHEDGGMMAHIRVVASH